MSNRSSVLQLWAIGMIAPLAMLINNVLKPTYQTDYFTLWTIGRALFGTANLYAADGLNFFYPPHALLFLAPFAPLPYLVSYLAWTVITGALFMWAAKPYMPAPLPPPLALLTPGALMCVVFGQTGLLVGALWLWAFRGKWGAVALLTFKPHLGLLSALSLRSKREVGLVAAATLGLIWLSAELFGPNLWPQFIERSLAHTLTSERWQFAGVTPAIAYGIIGWLPFAIAAGLLLARNVNAFTAATAALLVAPYGFHYDMPVASLGIGLFVYERWHLLGVMERIVLALAFLVPSLASLGVWWMPPILLAALWIQVGHEDRKRAATSIYPQSLA
jgi:hypothetical protein